MSTTTDYSPQKKYLEKQKQLRVWVKAEKYERFKALAQQNGDSIYSLVNSMIDDYLEKCQKGN